MATTSYGRGLAANAYRAEKIASRTARLTRKTIRCRQRRKTQAALTASSPQTGSAHREPVALSHFATASSQPDRVDVTIRVIAASKWSSEPVAKCSQTVPATTSSTAATHSLPVHPIALGNGGGAPVGR